MSLLSAGSIASIRSALEITLVHTCTITPMVASVEDAEGNILLVAGTPVAGVRCTFDGSATAVRDEGGATLVIDGALTVSARQAIAIGSRVTAITDSLGGTPPGGSGTFRVQLVLDATAELGAALLPTYGLKAASVSA